MKGGGMSFWDVVAVVITTAVFALVAGLTMGVF